MNLLKTKRKLGSHGPLVSNIGLGCFGLTFGKNSKVAEEEKLKVLNQAIDLGCNFFDTSDIYGFGENEKLISKVLKERRDEVFLCSKFGFKLDPITKLMPPCGTKEYVRECCLNSLGRLQIDYIDLYYQHR
ncbi:Aldo/keto reductase, partial [Neoconidiobolus thromboides FSU 785]